MIGSFLSEVELSVFFHLVSILRLLFLKRECCHFKNKGVLFSSFKHILLSYKCTIRLETTYINLVHPLHTIMLYT